MTHSRTRLGAILLPVAALSLSVFGLAAGSHAEDAAEDLPMQCEISVTRSAFGYTYRGLIHADETIEGIYELNISKRGGGSTNISQGGPFTVKAGATRTIGQASFGGMPPEHVEAELILHLDGKSYRCSTQTDI